MQLRVRVLGGELCVIATTEDGREVAARLQVADTAREASRMLETLDTQLAKRSSHYAFGHPVVSVEGPVPSLPTAAINGLRRELAQKLDLVPVHARPLRKGVVNPSVNAPSELSYKANIASGEDRRIYASRGAQKMEDAYELGHQAGVEYMRTKYCIRHQLGLCPRQGKEQNAQPLYLRNGKQRLLLSFDCASCEMTVS